MARTKQTERKVNSGKRTPSYALHASATMAANEQKKRRNAERNRKWTERYDLKDSDWQSMSMNSANEMLQNLLNDYQKDANRINGRMTDETKEKYKKLLRNLSRFMAVLHGAIYDFTHQNVFEIEEVTGFEFRFNNEYAAGYVKVKWKATLEFPTQTEEWIAYGNLSSGKLLKEWINHPDQNNHWIRQAMSDSMLVMSDFDSDDASHQETGVRHRDEKVSRNDMETFILNEGSQLEEGKILELKE